MLSGWILSLKVQQIPSRYAVFRFIWVWRQDYKEAIATITQPTLVVVGTQHRVLVGQAGAWSKDWLTT